MKILVSFLVVVCGLQGALAGRAFPIAAENFVIRLFQEINPFLEWDETNFLVDLSGRFALCKNAGRRGSIKVEQRTPQEEDIAGLLDTASGHETHAPAVTEYIQATLPSWVREPQFSNLIKRAETFGCSAQPGCVGGQVSIACLFSGLSSGIEPTAPPLREIAQAFTYKQYGKATRLTGVKWDNSHFLENLSGSETKCEMVHRDRWDFDDAKDRAADEGMIVQGRFGKTLNRGSTPRALDEILKTFKRPPFKKVGCSLIPDCMVGSQMWVVVSCLFSQQ